MRIALVGWGIETESVYRFFGEDHEYLIVSEEPRDDFPEGSNITTQFLETPREPGLTANVEDLSYLDGIDAYELIVLTPTAKKTVEKVHPPHDAIWQKATTNVQLFFEQCPTKNIIGVTGTKGKGTTSSLITELLRKSGKKVHLGGNIGVPALDLLPQISDGDWVVLELSNFQLYKFPYSPHIAVHLMMMPEHVAEWHGDMDDYVSAKANICTHQSENDIAIYLPSNVFSTQNAQLSPAIKIPYMQEPGATAEGESIQIDGQHIIDLRDLVLPGKHNLQNVCAAVTAAWQVVQDAAAMRDVLKEFRGLEHRLQPVRNIDEVTYIDDSFGTTPDTAIVAMDAFAEPKVMIVGGHDKGNDMSKVVERLQKDDIRSVIGIGDVGLTLVNLLRDINPGIPLHSKEHTNDWTMSEIVELAKNEAQPGDIVLLSAGTSSFGIFSDYKDRGNQFVETVNSL